MKSPKEILLQQSADAGSSLDAIRAQVIRPLRETRAGWSPTRFLAEAWTQLVWEGRMAWGGMAVVWICLFLVSAAPGRQEQPGGQPTSSRSVAAWQNHQRLLRAELNLPPEPDAVTGSVPRVRRQSRHTQQFQFA
jgi:hypothetical protein